MPLSKALFVASTDSYLKWAVALSNDLSESFEGELMVVKSLQNPSARQEKVALSGYQVHRIRHLHIFHAILRTIASKPNFVFVGGTGPFLTVFRWLLNFSSAGRKVKLVSGSPGIAFHLYGRPLEARTYADLIVVASRREKELFEQAQKNFGTRQSTIALSKLSFLRNLVLRPTTDGPKTLVFAPQPDMPYSLNDRERLLIELVRLKRANPGVKIIVKLRAIQNEPQTHFEKYNYQDIFEGLLERGLAQTTDMEFATGSIAEFLENSNSQLMTVSSTAALEAIAMKRPVHIISDFGISDSLANAVFEGSGLVGPISACNLMTDYSFANSEWLSNNYFHNELEDDLEIKLAALSKAKLESHFELIPKKLDTSLFIGEVIRTIFPNSLGKIIIRSLKKILGKSSA